MWKQIHFYASKTEVDTFRFARVNFIIAPSRVKCGLGCRPSPPSYLSRQQDMLPRLGHRSIDGGDDENTSVHLRRARDHVLDVIGVARAVNVRVVPLLRLVLDMRGGYRDSPRTLLRSLVDLIKRDGRISAGHVIRQDLRDGRRQSRLIRSNAERHRWSWISYDTARTQSEPERGLRRPQIEATIQFSQFK